MSSPPRIAEHYYSRSGFVASAAPRGGRVMNASAESIAMALGGRKTSRGWRALCPAHPDKHPSLDIEERGDRVLLVCRAGCNNRDEVIPALRERGLWSSTSCQPSRPIAERFPASAFHEPTAPPCCFEGPPSQCEHWREFDADMTIALLHSNLREAAAEVVTLFETAEFRLSPVELRDELYLAVELGGSSIVPWHLGREVVKRMIALVVSEVVEVVVADDDATTRAS